MECFFFFNKKSKNDHAQTSDGCTNSHLLLKLAEPGSLDTGIGCMLTWALRTDAVSHMSQVVLVNAEPGRYWAQVSMKRKKLKTGLAASELWAVIAWQNKIYVMKIFFVDKVTKFVLKFRKRNTWLNTNSFCKYKILWPQIRKFWTNWEFSILSNGAPSSK